MVTVMNATWTVIATGSATVTELKDHFNGKETNMKWKRIRPGYYESGPTATEGTYAIYDYISEADDLPKMRWWTICRWNKNPYTGEITLDGTGYTDGTLAAAKNMVQWLMENEEAA
jgi:hypothetical protein